MSRASFLAVAGAIAESPKRLTQFYLKAAFIVFKIYLLGGR
jgi:hypothetical protein